VRTKLAAIALQVGDRAEAARLLQDELKLTKNEQPPRQRDELGQMLLDADQPRQAAKVYQKLAGEHPQAARYLHQWATALFEDGSLRRGIAVARRAVRVEPEYKLAMHNLAVAHLEAGRPLRAIAWVRRALKIDKADRRLRRLRRRIRLALIGHSVKRFFASR